MSDLSVTVCSFGYKHGLPGDADFIFDVRCLPNPYWVESMKEKCGLDPDVAEYVFSSPFAEDYFTAIADASLMYLEKTKREKVFIYVGCTGGQHRSVAVAERLGALIKDNGYDCATVHRERAKFERGETA